MKNPHMVYVRTLLLVVLLPAAAFGWGAGTHRVINGKAVMHLHGAIAFFVQDSAALVQHASDADTRRQWDPSEDAKHFIDLDDYPDYLHLPHSLDTLIALYGSTRVNANGILPWATVWTYDSLVAQLRRQDWDRAMLTASDLGHYVGDAHQPLHVTTNYNGQLTGNYGIHSRYESTMLSTAYYLQSLTVSPSSVHYVADRLGFVFDYLLQSVALVDSILSADTYAKTVSGWNGSGDAPASYYAALWSETRSLTEGQVQNATEALACLWYSAWSDAGITSVAWGARKGPTQAALLASYPNPFNPATVITYSLPDRGVVSLSVFSVAGQHVTDLVAGEQSAGTHTAVFDGSSWASGTYYCRLLYRGQTRVIRLLLVR